MSHPKMRFCDALHTRPTTGHSSGNPDGDKNPMEYIIEIYLNTSWDWRYNLKDYQISNALEAQLSLHSRHPDHCVQNKATPSANLFIHNEEPFFQEERPLAQMEQILQTCDMDFFDCSPTAYSLLQEEHPSVMEQASQTQDTELFDSPPSDQ